MNKLSWLIGSISIILPIFGWMFFLHLMPESLYYSIPGKSWFGVMFLYFLLALILAIVGLLIGISIRKSGSQLSGFLGIALPIIAIFLTIFLGYTVELSIILRTT